MNDKETLMKLTPTGFLELRKKHLGKRIPVDPTEENKVMYIDFFIQNWANKPQGKALIAEAEELIAEAMEDQKKVSKPKEEVSEKKGGDS